MYLKKIILAQLQCLGNVTMAIVLSINCPHQPSVEI